MTAEVVLRLQELCDVTERQLDAAKRLDVVALSSANSERTDALFGLQVALAEGVPAADPEMGQLARKLSDLEDRLARVARTVLQSLGDGTSPVYDRVGRVG